MQPVLLIEVGLSSTLRIASRDIYVSDVFYTKGLLNEVALHDELSEIYFGVSPAGTVRIELDNSTGTWTSAEAGEELRNKSVTISRYDSTDTSYAYGYGGYGQGGYGGSAVGAAFQLRGKITGYNLREKAVIEVAVHDPNPFEALLPKKVLENDDFAGYRSAAAYRPSDDLGKPYNICFGWCEKVPLLYLYGDLFLNEYDYLIGYGTIERVVNVYRDKRLVSSSEYTVYDGSQASPYAGYAFIRFAKEQRDYGGALYPISADLYGLKMGTSSAQRNFVSVIEKLLSDSTWGLGLTVNSATFAAMREHAANLRCDGAITSQVRAANIRDDLLYACYASSLEENASGQWEIYVDHYQSWPDITYSDQGERLISVEEYGKTAVDDLIKDYTLEYALDLWEDSYFYRNTRTISSLGHDRTVQNRFIREHLTADRITCYYKQRMLYSDMKMVVTVPDAGQQLRRNTIVDLTLAYPWLTVDARFRVAAIEKRMSTCRLELEGYSSSIYTYSAGTMPNSGNQPGARIAPATVTGVAGTTYLKTWLFSWTKSAEDYVVAYHVQIATDSGFSSVVFDKADVRGITVSYTDSARSHGTLYCRVKAVAMDGTESASWSSTGSATTTGIVNVSDGSTVDATFGGDNLGTRDGQTYWYNLTGSAVAQIGAPSSGSYVAAVYGKTAGSSGLYVTASAATGVYVVDDGSSGRAILGAATGSNGIGIEAGATATGGIALFANCDGSATIAIKAEGFIQNDKFTASSLTKSAWTGYLNMQDTSGNNRYIPYLTSWS